MKSGQEPLRAFLAKAAASVRRVYSGPVSYTAQPFERVDWDHFDVVGVNYYRQQAPGAGQYLTKISQLQATGKPVAITEFGFASCQDADDPKFLSTFNAASWSMLGMARPVLRPWHSASSAPSLTASTARHIPALTGNPKEAFHAVARYYRQQEAG